MHHLRPFLVVLIGTSAIFAAGMAEYYPMHVGDYWLYDNNPVGSTGWAPRTITRTIDHADTMGGELYFCETEREKADNLSFDNIYFVGWLNSNVAGDILIAAWNDTTTLTTATIIDPPDVFIPKEYLTVGYYCDVPNPEGGTERDSVESITETVTVPAGTFINCVKVKYRIFNSSLVTTKYGCLYYAPGVGKVLEHRDYPASSANRSELYEYSSQTTNSFKIGSKQSICKNKFGGKITKCEYYSLMGKMLHIPNGFFRVPTNSIIIEKRIFDTSRIEYGKK